MNHIVDSIKLIRYDLFSPGENQALIKSEEIQPLLMPKESK